MAPKCMRQVEDIIASNVEYQPQEVNVPHLTGMKLKVFTWVVESSWIKRWVISSIYKNNKIKEILSEKVIPDAPMFVPQFPPQEAETAVKNVDEESVPVSRVDVALGCLPQYKPFESITDGSEIPFRYWRIRDYAHAYRTGSITPSLVAERIISAVEDSQKRKPSMSLFISFDGKEVMRQANESTERFSKGEALSILDGIFMGIKDEIDCFPHQTRGGTTWFHEVRAVNKDAECVARLRQCGVIFLGKTNQHELGSGTTGNNPHYGTARNPHDPNRYTGGSSAGSSALVACGICPAALGTDGGGSIRIPASLCGVVGLKTTHGRTSGKGVLELGWSVAVVSPIAASVEDSLLVYAAMLGSCSTDEMIVTKPMPPCFPLLQDSSDNHSHISVLSSLKLGKYTQWYNDVSSPEISNACDRALQLLSGKYGTKILEIVIPELEEMRVGHLVSIMSEINTAIRPYYEDGRRKELCYEIRSTVAMLRELSSCDYVSAQRIRRRIMFYHLEAFKAVDIIVTPTTGMTAPLICQSALSAGESNLVLSANLMQFIIAPNFIGLPAVTIPVGHDSNGLPIGLQFIGRPWSEATLLHLAYAVERLCVDFRKKPAVFYDVLK